MEIEKTGVANAGLFASGDTVLVIGDETDDGEGTIVESGLNNAVEVNVIEGMLDEIVVGSGTDVEEGVVVKG